MTSDATVLVRIKRGFGSHTLIKNELDEAGQKTQVPVIHRHNDAKAFLLPYSAYQENTAKYVICDPKTGQPAEPTIRQTNSISMSDKIEAATKKSGRKQQVVKAV